MIKEVNFSFSYFFFCFSFLKNLFIYFNWRLITLQYCRGFCHTLTWISHGCTCVPHSEAPLPLPSPSHLSGSSQCTGPEFSVSCFKPRLAIYFTYGNIHVSLIFHWSDRVPDELWNEVRDIVQETGIKTITRKRSAKKQTGCLGRPYK